MIPHFRVLTRAFVPRAADLDEEGWRRGEAIVSDALSVRPPSIRRQIGIFVRVVGLLAFLRYGRSLKSLSASRLGRLLGRLERAPLLLLRRGVWGLRTLAFMGYYGQASVREAIGYRADLRGWQDRGEDAGPWSDREGAGAPEAWVLTRDEGGQAANDDGAATGTSSDA